MAASLRMRDDRVSDAASAGSAPRPLIGRRLREHFASTLYRNAYFLMLGTGAGAILGFVFWALAARRYRPEDVGVNSAVIAAMMLVSGASQLGLNGLLVRYLPSAGRSTRRLVLWTYLLTGSLSAVAALVAALTSAGWSPRLAFLSENPRWLSTFVIATIAWTIFTLQDGVMTGMRQARWLPIENSLFAAAKLVLLVAVASVLPRSGIFLSWTVPAIISLIPVNALIFLRLIPGHVERAGVASFELRRMMRFASGNYLGTLFTLASTLFLPILVTNESDARATAYFFVPWTIAVAFQLIALNMTTSLTVEVAFDESRLRDYCRRVIVHTMRLVLPAALVLFVGAAYILRLFGPVYASQGATLLRVLVVGCIPNVIVVLGLSVARIQHSGRRVLWIQGAQCVVTLGLSFVLLPRLGIDGIGIAWLVSQLTLAFWIAMRILRPVFLVPVTAAIPADRALEGSDGR